MPEQTDPDMRPSRELRGLMLAVYREWSDGDPAFLELISDDEHMHLIGTDPAEWLRGGQAVKAVFGTQLAEGLGAVAIEPGELHAVEAGDVGWVVDNPVFRFDGGVEAALRSTVIFQRSSAGWKIVHWHVSIGAANEEALGIELTTSLESLVAAVEAETPDLGGSVGADGAVTIVFTDIESSTELNDALGDEAWVAILRRHDGFVRAAVEHEGGRVVKNQGDGYMLAFPRAEAGARCALAIQRRLAEPGDEVRIRVRMGLHAGHPIREADDFFGRDVAYAARVAAAARGGEVLASDAVRPSLEAAGIALAPARAVTFKGFAGEHAVHPLRGD